MTVVVSVVALSVSGFLSGCGGGGGGGGGRIEPEPPPISRHRTIAALAIRARGGSWSETRATATASESTPAVFHIAVANRGARRGRIRLRETSRSSGWTTRYFDREIGGRDITSALRSRGWYTPYLGTNQRVVIRLEVRPVWKRAGLPLRPPMIAGFGLGRRPPRPSSQPSTGTIRVRGYADNSDSVIAEVRYTEEKRTEPEILARLSGSSRWSKLVQPKVAEGQTAVVELSLRNKGKKSGSITLKAQGSIDKWSVKAFNSLSGGTDISSAVFGSGWAQSYSAGQTRYARVEISPKGARRNDRLSLMLLATADTSDSVTVTATMQGIYQPDLQISLKGQSYIGNDIYNTTGASQSVAVQAGSKTVVTFLIKLQNDGDFSDRFLIKESGYDSQWIARYYDSPTGGNEITNAVRTSGWRSSSIAPHASRTIRLEVVPGAQPEGATLELLLTASSVSFSQKKDAVRALTEKVATGVRTIKWEEVKKR